MSLNFGLKQQSCLRQLHPSTSLGTSNTSMHFCRSSKHICSCGAEPEVMPVTLASDPQLCLLCLYLTNGLVSKIAPDNQACTCLLQYHWPAVMSLTVSSYQHPWMLYLHPAIGNDCNNCIRPFVMSLTVAPSQQSYLLIAHKCMHARYTCNEPVLAFIFVIAISSHLCFLLHLHQTSIVVKVVTTVLDQQACILQFLPSSNVFNCYTHTAVMMVMNSMQI